ncbi:MAG: hypothetical protein P8X82_04965 [Gemmatimonadales bacterium]
MILSPTARRLTACATCRAYQAGIVPLLLWSCTPKTQDVETFAAQPDGPISFTRDVAPIVFEHCATCHRPSGSAPFSVLSYQEIKDWAPLIADAVGQRRMPPWLPEPGFGSFVNERRLNGRQIAVIRRWVEQGAIEGDPADLPPAPRLGDDWQLGEPDLIVKVPPYTLAAQGQEIYRNIVAPIPVAVPQYVRAVELRPGNAKAVHHARMMVDATESSRTLDAEDSIPGFDGMDVMSHASNPQGFFVGWTPGKNAKLERGDLAWKLEPGTDLVLQLHLRPTGRREVIAAQVGFHFAELEPERSPALILLGSFDIDIPAGASNYLVTDYYELPVDVDVLSVYPHAHYLGKELQGFATLPGGKKEWLIRIMDWDFNWQDDYRYVEPIHLRKGTVLTMHYTYDNTSDNPQNPSQPPRRVVFGARSVDEMAEMAIQVLPRNRADLQILNRGLSQKYSSEIAEYRATEEYRLGDRLAAQGRASEAADHYRAALRNRPDDTRVLLGLASVLIELEETEGAVLVAERAAQLTERDDPNIMSVLASAYAAAGRMADAVRTAQHARVLAEAAGLTDLAAELQLRVERYRKPGGQ